MHSRQITKPYSAPARAETGAGGQSGGLNPVVCLTECISKLHAAHEQSDEPQEITSLVADCVNGAADDERTSKFISGVRESTLSGIRFLLSMCEGSPETMAALSTAATMLDGLSNIPGLMG